MTGAAGAGPRIEALDVLRGLAVLGVLAVNAQAFAMPWPWFVQTALHPPATAADAAAYAVVTIFFQGKFIALFSMLFGVSLFLVGGADPSGGGRLRRRLLWLAVFGLIHGALIWYGDVLLLYALTGALVMAARSWRPRTLIVSGLVVLAVFGALELLGTVAVLALQADGTAQVSSADFTPAVAQALAEDGGYRGGFGGSLQANIRDWLMMWSLVNPSSVLLVGPLMLLGLGLFKAGVFTGEASPGVYRGFLTAGAAFLAVTAGLTAWEVRSGYGGAPAVLAAVVNDTLAPLATLAYIALIAPRTARGGLRGAARLLAPVGRMAFTNYLAQSVIMTVLFYGGRGPGLFGSVDRGGLLAVAACVWLLQILWSRWWLRRFAYGPMEWLWRSLTEGRRLPLRLGAQAG